MAFHSDIENHMVLPHADDDVDPGHIEFDCATPEQYEDWRQFNKEIEERMQSCAFLKNQAD